MNILRIHLSILVLCGVTAVQALGQVPVPPPSPQVQLLSAPQLDQLLGPIALYPDPLLGEILPAATTPADIVLADRYMGAGGDPNLIDQQPWSLSVKALARYPTVLKWVDDNLAWTTAVGQAFLYQQPDVMNSIQRLRARAMALGNLQSTPQENVVVDNGTIEILPADPNTLYVPVYQPDVVYFQQPFSVPFVSFGFGFAIGAWLNHDFDWHTHHLIVWHHDGPRPADWWARRPTDRRRQIEAGHVAVWQPHSHPGPAMNGLDRGWGAPRAGSPVTVIGARPPEPRPPPPPPHSTVAVIGAQKPQPPPHSTITVYGSHAEPKPEVSATHGAVKPAGGAHPAPVQQPKPAAAQRPAEVSHVRPANGALIGSSSAHEARQFSNRGQESRHEAVHPAAAPAHFGPPAQASAPAHSAPPSQAAPSGKH